MGKYHNSPQPRTFLCGVCGSETAIGARACRECGADERTGLREREEADGDLPEDLSEFNYEEFAAREFGGSPKPAGLAWHWWITGVALLALAVYWLIRHGRGIF